MRLNMKGGAPHEIWNAMKNVMFQACWLCADGAVNRLPAAKSEVHPAVPADTDESKPEPSPRAKPSGVTPKPPQATKAPLVACTSGPLSPARRRPSSTYISGKQGECEATTLKLKNICSSHLKPDQVSDWLIPLCVRWMWQCSNGQLVSQSTTSCSSPEEGTIRTGASEYQQQPCRSSLSSEGLVPTALCKSLESLWFLYIFLSSHRTSLYLFSLFFIGHRHFRSSPGWSRHSWWDWWTEKCRHTLVHRAVPSAHFSAEQWSHIRYQCSKTTMGHGSASPEHDWSSTSWFPLHGSDVSINRSTYFSLSW